MTALSLPLLFDAGGGSLGAGANVVNVLKLNILVFLKKCFEIF